MEQRGDVNGVRSWEREGQHHIISSLLISFNFKSQFTLYALTPHTENQQQHITYSLTLSTHSIFSPSQALQRSIHLMLGAPPSPFLSLTNFIISCRTWAFYCDDEYNFNEVCMFTANFNALFFPPSLSSLLACLKVIVCIWRTVIDIGASASAGRQAERGMGIKKEKSRRLDERGGGVGHGKSIHSSLFFPSILVCTWKTTITLFHSTFSATYTFRWGRYHLAPQYNFQPSTSHNFSIIMVFSHIHSLYKSSGVGATVYVESKTNMQAQLEKDQSNFPTHYFTFFGRGMFWKCLILDICAAIVSRCFPKKADSEFYVFSLSVVVGPNRRLFLFHVMLCLALVIFVQMGRLTQHHTQLPGNRSTPILLLFLCLFTFLNRLITVVFPPIVLWAVDTVCEVNQRRKECQMP